MTLDLTHQERGIPINQTHRSSRGFAREVSRRKGYNSDHWLFPENSKIKLHQVINRTAKTIQHNQAAKLVILSVQIICI